MLILDIFQGNTILNPYILEEDPDLKEYYDLTISIVEHGQARGEFRQGKPADLVFTFISGLLGVAFNWSASGGAYDGRAELRRLFETVFLSCVLNASGLGCHRIRNGKQGGRKGASR